MKIGQRIYVAVKAVKRNRPEKPDWKKRGADHYYMITDRMIEIQNPNDTVLIVGMERKYAVK